MICRPVSFLVALLTSAPTGPLSTPPAHGKSKLRIPQTPASRPPSQTATAGCTTPRLINRTIQALRQENLLVCERKRSWPEVLLVCQSPGRIQTGNGLRSTRVQRTCGAALGKLQIDARNFGRNLRHQSRTIIPTRGVLAAPCRRLFARQRSPCSVFLWPT